MENILKKQMLLKLFKDRKTNSCTILGIPTKELQDYYFTNKDLMGLFQKYDVDNPVGEFDKPPINIWFPRYFDKICTELCAINISKSVREEELNNILNNFFKEVIEYYQIDMPPSILLKILRLSSEKLTFADMLFLIKEKQVIVAERIGFSRQTLSDVKSGKSKLTLKALSTLTREYPLLPWIQYVEQIADK